MALKGKWTDKTDGIDIASAEDINSVAHAVIELEDGIENVSGVYVGSGEMPEGYNVQIDPDGDASIRLEVGAVETLEAGKDATASITGTVDEPILNLGIPRGKDGATPTIGDNGNWWIDGEDTGTKAQGEKGEPGQDLTDKEWTLFHETALTEAVIDFTVTPTNQYKEVFVQCVFVIDPIEGQSKAVDIIIGRPSVNIVRYPVTLKEGKKVYFRAHGQLTPQKTITYESCAAVGEAQGYPIGSCWDISTKEFAYFPEIFMQTSIKSVYKLGAGSTIKIWGR